jgi:hypothetical protein
MNEDTFKMWLQEVQGMKERSASDVESRRKRALAYIQESKTLGDAAGRELELLDKTMELKTCSPFVRSQLRRALRLFEEYNKSEKR